ncbi:MAG: hypothetical protein WA116_00955 [Anaerolineaceae bacterium]
MTMIEKDLTRVEAVVLKAILPYSRQELITRTHLVAVVNRMGFRIEERAVRDVIKNLRRKGYLICALPGVEGGYYIAQSRKEYEEFRQKEYIAKISDMSKTVRAMDTAAITQFGDAQQLELNLDIL